MDLKALLLGLGIPEDTVTAARGKRQLLDLHAEFVKTNLSLAAEGEGPAETANSGPTSGGPDISKMGYLALKHHAINVCGIPVADVERCFGKCSLKALLNSHNHLAANESSSDSDCADRFVLAEDSSCCVPCDGSTTHLQGAAALKEELDNMRSLFEPVSNSPEALEPAAAEEEAARSESLDKEAGTDAADNNASKLKPIYAEILIVAQENVISIDNMFASYLRLLQGLQAAGTLNLRGVEITKIEDPHGWYLEDLKNLIRCCEEMKKFREDLVE